MDYVQKYRVNNFADIKGNDAVIQLLKNRVARKSIPNFSIIYGIPGTCKTSLSYLLIKAAKCEHPTADGEPCNNCASCKSINDSLYVDNKAVRGSNIYVYSMAQEETQDTNINAIIALLKAPNRPGTERFIIINELHNCSIKKQQNLLTPLESIPEGTYVIVTTTDFLTKIAEGIRSRAKSYQLVKASVDELVDRLKEICDNENLHITKKDLQKLVRIKECNMRECLNTLEDLSIDATSTWDLLLKEYSKDLEELINFLKASKSGLIDLIAYTRTKENAVEFVKALPSALYKAISLKDVADQIVEADLRKRINEQMERISITKVNDIIKSLMGLGHITEDDAMLILFTAGCEINNEVFRTVTHTDIDNSLNKVNQTVYKDPSVKVFTANECLKEDKPEVTPLAVMEYIQNDVGEVNLEDIEGDEL